MEGAKEYQHQQRGMMPYLEQEKRVIFDYEQKSDIFNVIREGYDTKKKVLYNLEIAKLENSKEFKDLEVRVQEFNNKISVSVEELYGRIATIRGRCLDENKILRFSLADIDQYVADHKTRIYRLENQEAYLNRKYWSRVINFKTRKEIEDKIKDRKKYITSAITERTKISDKIKGNRIKLTEDIREDVLKTKEKLIEEKKKLYQKTEAYKLISESANHMYGNRKIIIETEENGDTITTEKIQRTKEKRDLLDTAELFARINIEKWAEENLADEIKKIEEEYLDEVKGFRDKILDMYSEK